MKKLLYTAAILSSIIACKKDDPTSVGAPATNVSNFNSQEISSSADVLSSDFTELANSEEVTALNNLSQLTTSNNLISRKAKVNRIDRYRNIIKSVIYTSSPNRKVGDKAINFSEHTGTYNYNAVSKQWDKNLNGFSSTIVINFPATQQSTTNNGQITISSYNEQKVTIEEERYTYNPTSGYPTVTTVQLPNYLPSSLNASLKVNNQVKSTVIFSASYTANGIPQNINANITSGKFRLTMKHSDNSSGTSSSLQLTKTGRAFPLFASQITSTRSSLEQDKHFTDRIEYADNIKGYVQLSQFRINGNLDAKSLRNKSISNSTATGMNQLVDVSLSNMQTNSKVASLEFYDKVNTDPYSGTVFTNIEQRVVHSNGTKEDLDAFAENHLKQPLEKLEQTVSNKL